METNVGGSLEALGERIVSCGKCQRLSRYISVVASAKARRFDSWTYWGRPLAGFGDPDAELLIIGLAPAAHGGNRTGRMFTGDSSGDWLIRALYENGFANQPHSISRDDGLELASTYITAVVRCAPPKNKPTRQEILNCSEYLTEELGLLKEIRIVLTLGRVAFDTYIRHLNCQRRSRQEFRHGLSFRHHKDKPLLVASYHPSRQNTQTGRLTWNEWLRVFKKIRKLLDNTSTRERVHH
jgi:uracil-DNA glycosylase family 4